jgi:spore photoproduct lyase
VYPDRIFYEPAALDYALGRQLRKKFEQIPWIPVKSHNNIEQLRKNENRQFAANEEAPDHRRQKVA